MYGGKNKQPLGYTILEVMIVLAISAVMFLIAASFINGKQETTSFDSGVNDMQSVIQNTIEQVTDGQYSDEPIDCNTPPGPNEPVSVNGGADPATTQGSNPACVFLGKFIHYPVGGDQYEIQSIVGQRVDPTTGIAVTEFSDTAAAVVKSLNTTQDNPQTLTIKSVTAYLTSTNAQGGVTTAKLNPATASIGFLQSLGSLQTTDSTLLQSGSQDIELYAYSGTSEVPTGVDLSGPNEIVPITSADICVSDGTRYADVTLGPDSTSSSGSGQLSVNVKLDGTSTC
jgi:prepilin-type N-terminal cleavage/methylation domain-containing protein